MSEKLAYGFIGGGNMGEALIKGLLAGGLVPPGEVIVAEPEAGKRRHLVETYQVLATTDAAMAAAKARTVILAVKPQVMTPVLTSLRAQELKPELVISIAAGVRLNKIEPFFPPATAVVRAMPNTAALVGASATALCAGQGAGPEQMAAARRFFESVGQVVEVAEKYMDAVTGLSGSGPAYFFVILEALSDAGVLQGLTREQSQLLAAQTMLGAAQMALMPGAHPARLKDQVTSPGGTTITALGVLEKGALRSLLMEAVGAATRRSKELGG